MDSLRAEQGKHILGLLGGKQVHLESIALCAGGETFNFQQTLPRTSHPERPDLFPIHDLTGFLFQFIVERDALLKHTGGVAAGSQLTHQSRRVPCGTVRDLVLLDDGHTGLAHLGEMIGRRAADHTGADDDNFTIDYFIHERDCGVW